MACVIGWISSAKKSSRPFRKAEVTMFDPQTAELIRAAPNLPGLDRDRLPEELTKAFTAIVAFRVRLGQSGGQLPDGLREQLDVFRRMAATFEAMVALLPDRADRSASAFVAAQAYQLLHLARKLTAAPNAVRPRPLRDVAISPEVSALLLFLIANQPSDATEMARSVVDTRPEGNATSAMLVDALAALAHGRLARIGEMLSRVSLELPEELQDAATETLYRRLLEGLARLAQQWLGNASRVEGMNAVEVFREVQRLAVEPLPWPDAQETSSELAPISAFAGPHHLATLLISGSDMLSRAALSAIQPPSGITPEDWQNLTANIVAERPFLWPNHL